MTLLLFRVQPFGAPRSQRDSLKKQRLLVLRVVSGYLSRPVAITSVGLSPLVPAAMGRGSLSSLLIP